MAYRRYRGSNQGGIGPYDDTTLRRGWNTGNRAPPTTRGGTLHRPANGTYQGARPLMNLNPTPAPHIRDIFAHGHNSNRPTYARKSATNTTHDMAAHPTATHTGRDGYHTSNHLPNTNPNPNPNPNPNLNPITTGTPPPDQITTIVDAVLARLGCIGFPPKRNGHTTQPTSTTTTHPPITNHQDGDARRPSPPRDPRLNNGGETETTTSTTPTTDTSDNPLFQTLCRAIMKSVQNRHHAANWLTLPSSIRKNLTSLGENICPPEPNDTYTRNIRMILERAGEEIRTTTLTHIRENANAHESLLMTMDPRDKERARGVAEGHLLNRLGKRRDRDNITHLLATTMEMVGILHTHPHARTQTNHTTHGTGSDTEDQRTLILMDTIPPEGPEPRDAVTTKKPPPENPARNAGATTTPPNLMDTEPSTPHHVTPPPQSMIPHTTHGNRMPPTGDPIPTPKACTSKQWTHTEKPTKKRPRSSDTPPYTTLTNRFTPLIHSEPRPDTPNMENPRSEETTRGVPDAMNTPRDRSTSTDYYTPYSAARYYIPSPLPPSPPANPPQDTTTTQAPPGDTPQVDHLIDTPGPYANRKTIHPPKTSMNTIWDIHIWNDTRVLVISDANFQDIRPNIIPEHWQLEILPGANTYDVTEMIQLIPQNTELIIVASAGIHDVMHRNVKLAKDTRDLCDLLKTYDGYAVGLCVNENLDPPERNNVDIIDGIYTLSLNEHYINPGTRRTTCIDPRNVLYPPPTATSIWLKIISHIQSVIHPNVTPLKNRA